MNPDTQPTLEQLVDAFRAKKIETLDAKAAEAERCRDEAIAKKERAHLALVALHADVRRIFMPLIQMDLFAVKSIVQCSNGDIRFNVLRRVSPDLAWSRDDIHADRFGCYVAHDGCLTHYVGGSLAALIDKTHYTDRDDLILALCKVAGELLGAFEYSR